METHKLDKLTRPRTKIGNNTYAFKYDEAIVIKYHDNPIAVITPTKVTLTLAGWGTRTTRDRLNEIANHCGLNASYTQRDFKQYLNDELISPYDTHTWSR